MKAAIFNDKPVKKSETQDGPPIVPVRLMYYDREHMVPLEIIDHDFLGTREEIHGIISRRHKELLESAEYRKHQNKMFVTLKGKFGMKDRQILDALIPDASKDERDKVYNRLKRHWARYNASREGTASTWDEVPHVPHRYLGFAFGPLDKEALFFDGLGVFDPDDSVGGQVPIEDYRKGKYDELLARFDAELNDATLDLPVLRRFLPEYEDGFVAPEEIEELRRECEFVRVKTESPSAPVSIDK